MPITCNSKLSHMGITVKELTEKHQLNPKNNGITGVDNIVFYNESNKNCGIGTLTRICRISEEMPIRIRLTNGDQLIVSMNTKLLNDKGEYVSYANNKLQPATKLLNVQFPRTITSHAVLDITPLDKLTSISLICSDRDNYVLDNGFIVACD